jgi:hypothetical protein
MPGSTFLPALAWARLAIELPDESALATAWLAINDAAHAYEQAQEGFERRIEKAARLVPRLELVATAAAATMAVLPPPAGAPLREVLNLSTAAAQWAASIAHGGPPGPSASLERRIMDLHHAWPVPAVLPTLDDRPLDVMDQL